MVEPIRGSAFLGRVPLVTSANCGNLLLRSLSAEAFADLRPYLEPILFEDGQIMVAQDETITSVCFPESIITSVADVQPDGTRIEVALIGREGMTNSQLLLGSDRASLEGSVQIGGGRSLRVCAEVLQQFCKRHPSAHMLFLRHVHALSVQTARTLASNVRDPVEKRLARWLLMFHDRIDGDEIRLIHEHLGRMLGVRRATVTDRLHILEGHGAVRNKRGRIMIRDRALLERLAGPSYGFAEQQHGRPTSPFGGNAPDQPIPLRASA